MTPVPPQIKTFRAVLQARYLRVTQWTVATTESCNAIVQTTLYNLRQDSKQTQSSDFNCEEQPIGHHHSSIN